MAGTVDDEEQLFRRIRDSVAGQPCFRTEGDRVIFSQAAFNDPDKSPSIERQRLKSNPQLTRIASEDGIVTLRANEIRKLGPIAKLTNKNKPAKDNKGRPITYDVDVVPNPRFGNCAHALVVTNPETTGSGTFKRLKDALARLATEAGWTVAPNTPLTARPEHPLIDAMHCFAHRASGKL